jgi:LL-diaminopimelate aminotransferase
MRDRDHARQRFGEPGEGYVRFALTVGKERMAEAIERMKKLAL